MADLYNDKWTVLTYVSEPQPAKVLYGNTLESILANGVIVSNCSIERSVLSYAVHVNDQAQVLDSILLGHNIISKGAIIRNAIIDKWVNIPAGETVGINKELDLTRGFTVSPGGITVVPRNYVF